MTKEQVCQAIDRHKIVVILRKVPEPYLQPLVQALYHGGIRLFEVTFVQDSEARLDETAQALKTIRATLGSEVVLGAGTVLCPAEVDRAKQAGAGYIISPGFDPAVVRHTLVQGLVSIPGAMTPSEILQAHHAGADYVKLFPAGDLGLGYAKSLLGPISHVKLLAVGGISEKNLEAYLQLGFAGAGVGGALVDKALMQAGDFAQLRQRAATMVQIAERFR